MTIDIEIPEPPRPFKRARPNHYRSAIITSGILLYLGLMGFAGAFIYQTHERVDRVLTAVETIAQANANMAGVIGGMK